MEFNIKTKTAGRCRVYPDSPNGLQPSVTSICGALMKYGLIQWSADCAVDYMDRKINDWLAATNPENLLLDDVLEQARHAHDQIRDDAADFGTLAHLLCQLWLEGKNDDLQTELDKIECSDIKHKAMSLFESFCNWADKNKIEPVHTEIKLHGDGYSGRCDLIAYRTCPKTGERRLGLYDIKTGKGSYYPEWGLQLAAYAKAYDPSDKDKSEWNTKELRDACLGEIGIIKLNKDTLKCNFSEQSKPKFTASRDRLTEAWKSLVKFYWCYNDLETQFKEMNDEDS